MRGEGRLVENELSTSRSLTLCPKMIRALEPEE